MKVIFDKTTLVIQAENYTEKLALEKWSDNYFVFDTYGKNVGIQTDSEYNLLITFNIFELEKSTK